MQTFLYQDEKIGIKPLEHIELSGNYPNWFHDLDVCHHNRHGVYPMPIRKLESFVESLADDRSQIVWAVYALDQSLHIGNISLQQINLLDRSAEIAFLFGEKKYWNRGYALLSAQYLIKHGFEKLNLHRIGCGTSSSNLGMQKLAKKLGMVKEGVRRQSLYLNGNYVDIVEYGLLREEWVP